MSLSEADSPVSPGMPIRKGHLGSLPFCPFWGIYPFAPFMLGITTIRGMLRTLKAQTHDKRSTCSRGENPWLGKRESFRSKTLKQRLVAVRPTRPRSPLRAGAGRARPSRLGLSPARLLRAKVILARATRAGRMRAKQIPVGRMPVQARKQVPVRARRAREKTNPISAVANV